MELQTLAPIDSQPMAEAEPFLDDFAPMCYDDLECEVESRECGAILRLRGALSHAGAFQFSATVDGVAAWCPKRLAMDLSEILTFDSVGLGQLNSAIRKLRQSGCSVAVANVPPNLERTMRMLSLDIGVQFIDDVSGFLNEAAA